MSAGEEGIAINTPTGIKILEISQKDFLRGNREISFIASSLSFVLFIWIFDYSLIIPEGR